LGYVFGSLVAVNLHPSWGFWFVAIAGAGVLLLVVLTPETRPVVRGGIERRWHSRGKDIEAAAGAGGGMGGYPPHHHTGRAELHLTVYGAEAKWWWREVFSGWMLMARMLSQPGFIVLLLFVSWGYGLARMTLYLLIESLRTTY